MRAWLIGSGGMAAGALVTLMLLHGIPGGEPDRPAARTLLPEAAPTAPIGTRPGGTDLAVTEQLAVTSVARIWAEREPDAALSRSTRISDDALRSAYESAAVAAWSLADPVAALRHAATHFSGAEQAVVAHMLDTLSRNDVVELVGPPATIGNAPASGIRIAALRRLAQLDPRQAAEHIGAMSNLTLRRSVASSIAAELGRSDPDAALAWARNLEPPVPGIETQVLGGIARTDPLRAFDLALATNGRDRNAALLSVVSSAAATAGVDMHALADRVTRIESAQTRETAMNQLVQNWAARDPSAAVDWMLQLGSAASPRMVQSLANRLVHSNPDVAEAYVNRVPAELRPGWIEAVAGGMADTEPQRAADWIRQFRSEPAYGPSAAAVAMRMAPNDPRAAARLLEGVPADDVGPALVNVASNWARTDPRAAAQWAAQLDAPGKRTPATGIVAQAWVQQNRRTAVAWALNMARGPERDGALTAMVSAAAAQSGSVDTQLLNAIEADASRQQAAVGAAVAVARTDEAAARAVLDRYVTEPALREQGENLIEQSVRGRIGRGFSPYPGNPRVILNAPVFAPTGQPAR